MRLSLTVVTVSTKFLKDLNAKCLKMNCTHNATIENPYIKILGLSFPQDDTIVYNYACACGQDR